MLVAVCIAVRRGRRVCGKEGDEEEGEGDGGWRVERVR